MIYAGIGARQTPSHVLNQMEQIAIKMAEQGHTLRSGGAKGADTAFETGCDIVHGIKEIYLPWKGFNKSASQLYQLDEAAFHMAEDYHPDWNRLSDAAMKFMARNSYQVLGLNLNEPCNAIICWTPGGRITGGTGQALRMANAFGIPIINLASIPENQIMEKLNKFIEIKQVKLPTIIPKKTR